MKPHTICPVCGNSKLRQIGARTAEFAEPPSTVQQSGINAILKHVLSVRFLVTESLLCGKCRHLFLSPAFEEEELNRLYSPACVAETKRQYREMERATGSSWAAHHGIRGGDQENFALEARRYRPRRLYELVTAISFPGAIRNILDFGARTGELTECFPPECRRYVHDKDLSEVGDAAVIPLGSFEAIRSQGPYDLIVLSHVLEHVPHPVRLLNELGVHLAPGGVFYVEVPLEYCGTVLRRRGIPVGAHVNYFCRTSLLECIRSASLHCLAIRREIAPYGECQGPVLKAVAGRTRPAGFGCRRWPWWFDLTVDALLTVRARTRRKRFR